MRTRVRLACAVLCLLTSCDEAARYQSYSASSDTVEVPTGAGTPVLTDGTFSPGEWDDAARLIVNDSITLYFKQYDGHVFLGVHCPELTVPVFDLFLAPETGVVHQLHISAQLGERVLNAASDDADDPAFVWGRTTDWYANEIRWDERRLQAIVESGAKTRDEAFPDVVFPQEGAEFQIKRAKFPGESWQLRLETMWHGSHLVFPTGTTRRDTTDWIVFVLN